MTTLCENPVSFLPYYNDSVPDITCPHCGAEWCRYEHWYESDHMTSEQPLTASGQYCKECVGQQSTDALMEEYQISEIGDQIFALYCLFGERYEETPPIFDDHDPVWMTTLMRKHERERYLIIVREYISGDKSRKDAYYEWLREKF